MYLSWKHGWVNINLESTRYPCTRFLVFFKIDEVIYFMTGNCVQNVA